MEPITNFFKILFNTIYKILKPLSRSEDDRRKEFLVNIILFSFITLFGIFDFIIEKNAIQLGQKYHGVSPIVFSAILIFFIFLYFLSKFGYFIISGYLILLTLFLAITYSAKQWGVDLPSVLLGYALIIAI